MIKVVLFYLRVTLAGMLAGALVACNPVSSTSTTSTTPSIGQIVTDVQTLAAGLQGAMSGLSAAGVPANVVAQIQQYVTEAQGIAAQVGSATSSTSITSLVSGLPTLISGIASTVGASLPADFQMALSAAQVLLPVIMAAAGVMLAPAPEAAAPAMSVDDARTHLRNEILYHHA